MTRLQAQRLFVLEDESFEALDLTAQQRVLEPIAHLGERHDRFIMAGKMAANPSELSRRASIQSCAASTARSRTEVTPKRSQTFSDLSAQKKKLFQLTSRGLGGSAPERISSIEKATGTARVGFLADKIARGARIARLHDEIS